jgi:DNA-binding XRE family transcriptional regulator
MTRQELKETRLRLGYRTRRALAEALGVSKRAVDSWEEGWSPVPTWMPVALIGLNASKIGGFMAKPKKEKSKRNILRDRVVDLVVEFIKSEGGISQYDLQTLF